MKQFRCGGMFNYRIVRSWLLSLSVKEYWESVAFDRVIHKSRVMPFSGHHVLFITADTVCVDLELFQSFINCSCYSVESTGPFHILVWLWPPLCFILFSSFFLLFFLAYSQWSQIGCLPYFRTWCGLSVNLECRSEMCCTRLAKIQDVKIRLWTAKLNTIMSYSLCVVSVRIMSPVSCPVWKSMLFLLKLMKHTVIWIPLLYWRHSTLLSKLQLHETRSEICENFVF